MAATTVTAIASYYLPPKDGSRAYKNINDRYDCNYIRDNVEVQVEDIRGKEHLFHLDKAGFQYFTQPSSHVTFSNDEEIVKEYYLESEQVYKKLTGASKVHIFDHTVRRHIPGDQEEGPDKRQPVFNVHIDQTPAAARARIYRYFPKEEADSLLSKHRFQICNLWRPISHAAYDTPLGFIDSSTIDYSADLFPMTLKFPGGPGETFAVRWSTNHHWCYLPGMTPDEIVLFKCYDSAEDQSIINFNAHSAFVDPTTPPDAPLRQSIELRAILFFD
ncbi:hypothetical protein BDP27DRAFT_1300329 [Rhodocollybia butyracea]|uniref:Methyltransferase n=1 Tax=Rhodocollybia butyracea TaxID=206335 RepID=A0A9P5PCD7_9AGAR|nr:hypothetical protein BDP27DRAFT_1300329 [Rhodocollybia butyracea]